MSTVKNVSDVVTETQGKEVLVRLVNAGMTGSIAQGIIGARGNKKAKAMMAAINSEVVESSPIVAKPVEDGCFRLVATVDMVVPENYVHATQLATFVAKHGEGRDKKLYHLNSGYTDGNFARVTDKLAPGQKLAVDIYQITPRASSEACVNLVQDSKGLFVGAQGLTLAYELIGEKLLKVRWHLSPDKKENLPVLDGCFPVPILDCVSAGDFRLNLSHWEGDWDAHCCVLVFRDQN